MLPFYLARILATKASLQQVQLLQSFSLLLLGATLSTLATLNFSLALVIGIICSPLSFVRPLPRLPSRKSMKTVDDAHDFVQNLAVALTATVLVISISPPILLYAANAYFGKEIGWTLLEMAKGWSAQGVWTSLVVWGIWWPAWVVGGSVLVSGAMREGSEDG